MNRTLFNRAGRYKAQSGFTLIELALTAVLVLIPILAVTVLLVNGQNTWNAIYQSTTNRVYTDSQAVLTVFGQTGRKSNRPSCPTGWA